ncbi:uncharacterized protein LOC121328283 [Polyodon spathula]|uniref:uncharacterized protein LOC121328283 n=1 Tax=Polyodon spathula TaxID=7913 RepID=UPI001B7F4793|nr:uncharacterized protein LOC121328283 [Polyodon spathula]
MDDFDYSVHISDKDWDAFLTESEECSLSQPSLAGLEESCLSDADDSELATPLSRTRPVRLHTCSVETTLPDFSIIDPPDFSGSPSEHDQPFYTSQYGSYAGEDVLSGSDEEMDLETVNRFLEKFKEFAGQEKSAMQDQSFLVHGYRNQPSSSQTSNYDDKPCHTACEEEYTKQGDDSHRECVETSQLGQSGSTGTSNREECWPMSLKLTYEGSTENFECLANTQENASAGDEAGLLNWTELASGSKRTASKDQSGNSNEFLQEENCWSVEVQPIHNPSIQISENTEEDCTIRQLKDHVCGDVSTGEAIQNWTNLSGSAVPASNEQGANSTDSEVHKQEEACWPIGMEIIHSDSTENVKTSSNAQTNPPVEESIGNALEDAAETELSVSKGPDRSTLCENSNETLEPKKECWHVGMELARNDIAENMDTHGALTNHQLIAKASGDVTGENRQDLQSWTEQSGSKGITNGDQCGNRNEMKEEKEECWHAGMKLTCSDNMPTSANPQTDLPKDEPTGIAAGAGDDTAQESQTWTEESGLTTPVNNNPQCEDWSEGLQREGCPTEMVPTESIQSALDKSQARDEDSAPRKVLPDVTAEQNTLVNTAYVIDIIREAVSSNPTALDKQPEESSHSSVLNDSSSVTFGALISNSSAQHNTCQQNSMDCAVTAGVNISDMTHEVAFDELSGDSSYITFRASVRSDFVPVQESNRKDHVIDGTVFKGERPMQITNPDISKAPAPSDPTHPQPANATGFSKAAEGASLHLQEVQQNHISFKDTLHSADSSDSYVQEHNAGKSEVDDTASNPGSKPCAVIQDRAVRRNSTEHSNVEKPPQVHAISPFWDVMEKLTINDILYIKQLNNSKQAREVPVHENTTADVSDTADCEYSTHLEDDKRDTSYGNDIYVTSDSEEFLPMQETKADRILDFMQFVEPQDIPITSSSSENNEAQLWRRVSETGLKEAAQCAGAGIPHLTTAPSEFVDEKCFGGICKDISEKSLRALEIQASKQHEFSVNERLLLQSCKEEAENACLSAVNRPRLEDSSNPIVVPPLICSASDLPDKESFKISISEIFGYLFGGSQHGNDACPVSNTEPSTMSVKDRDLCNLSVPEMYDYFFSEFEAGGEAQSEGNMPAPIFPHSRSFDKALTVPEMYDYFFSEFEAGAEAQSEGNMPAPIFPRSRSFDKALTVPEMYDYFFPEEDGENLHEEGEEDSGPIHVVTHVDQSDHESTFVPVPEAYDYFFNNKEREGDLFGMFTTSLRRRHFTTGIKKALAGIMCMVQRDKTEEQPKNKLHPSRAGKNENQDLSALQIQFPEYEVLRYIEEQTRSTEARAAAAAPRKGNVLMTLDQSDMGLVCIAFASWVIKSANPHSPDLWKTALLANVSVISAIQYLRRYGKEKNPKYL